MAPASESTKVTRHVGIGVSILLESFNRQFSPFYTNLLVQTSFHLVERYFCFFLG